MAVTARNETTVTRGKTNRRNSQRSCGCWLAVVSFILERSPLGKELGDLVSGNRAFTNNPPARNLVAEIDDGGSYVPGRCTAVDNDIDATLQLLAHLLGAGALRGTAKVRGSRSDGDGRG